MASGNLEKRVESLENRLAEVQASLANDAGRQKDWRRAVEKYAGDEDLLAVFAEARKLREAERKAARQSRPRRTKS